MKLYLRQEYASLGSAGSFDIYDEYGLTYARVKAEPLTFRTEFHIYNLNDEKQVSVERKLFSIKPRY